MEYLTDTLFMCDLFVDTADVITSPLLAELVVPTLALIKYMCNALLPSAFRRPIAAACTDIVQRTVCVLTAADSGKLQLITTVYQFHVTVIL